MESTRQLSIGDIAEQLLTDRLIDSCELQRDRVIIVQDSARHSFPYDQAHAFMTGMLRGRSWTADSGSEGDGAYPDDLETPYASLARPLEPALDELASTARNMELIDGHEMVGDGTVKIALSSCETELYVEEAIAFLAECILHKFNTMLSEARLSTPIHSAEWSRDRQTQPAVPGN